MEGVEQVSRGSRLEEEIPPISTLLALVAPRAGRGHSALRFYSSPDLVRIVAAVVRWLVERPEEGSASR